jgi:hypothetical protein
LSTGRFAKSIQTGYPNKQAYVVRLEYIHRLDEAQWGFAEFLRNAKAGFQSVYGSFRALG